MKKNFLVTTGIAKTWEFSENNFLLGKWCEFYEFNDFDKKKFSEIKFKEISIIKNTYHWDDDKKRAADYKYLKEKFEYLLEIISSKLSKVHNINEDKEYWRIVISYWLGQYLTTLFDRWENVRIFFEKNKDKEFYSNFISLKNSDYVPKKHLNFIRNTQNDDWNHLIYLRIFRFFDFQNLSLTKKEIAKTDLKYMYPEIENTPKTNFIKLADNMISKIAFKFNKIIFDTFYFPPKEYLKICIKCKLIPSRFTNFFNFNVEDDNLQQNDKRIDFKKLLLDTNPQDKFIKFLLVNVHNDIPKSYLEDFNIIKKKILPLAKKKKIIFSMHSIFVNDNFKTYIAETKKVGSKYIHSDHGGGLTTKHDVGREMDSSFNFLEKISDQIIKYDNTEKKQNIFVNLSPTLPTIKFKNKKEGTNCSIIFYESVKCTLKFTTGPGLVQTINIFNELTQLVKNLNPEIKSNIKFRIKTAFFNEGYNYEKKFSEMFGKKSIDKYSFSDPNNNFKNTLLNSKLIIITYPVTAFSEAMYVNVPTILITSKNHWRLSDAALKTFDILKESKIAFESFEEAKIHINKNWKELSTWWESSNVQLARKTFLKNFFNVKPNWPKEWSDYIYSTSFHS